MTEPGSHADSHDLDKLERWSRELASAERPGFPVYAVFLVGPEDRIAHDVFREFRSRFGDMGAGFQHLVIFGQHGVSTTVLGLMDQLRLPSDSLPMLALFHGPSAVSVHTLALAGGDSGKDAASPATPAERQRTEPWRAVLDWLPTGVGEGGQTLEQASIPGLESRTLESQSLEALVSGLLAG